MAELYKEKLFRLQVFQYALSTLYMYPLRLYNNNCYEEFNKFLHKDSGFLDELNCILVCEDYKSIIPTIKHALKSNPTKYSQDIFNLLDKYSESLLNSIWMTKPSNSLSFVREIKSNRKLWLQLMLYDLFDQNTVVNEFETPCVKECLIGMKSVYLRLDDDCTIVVGRVFDTKHDVDAIIQNVIKNFEINNLDIFELTKHAYKRNFFEIESVSKDALEIKKAFTFFMSIMDKLPLDVSKEDIEKVSVFIYMIVKNSKIDSVLNLENVSIHYDNSELYVVLNNKSVILNGSKSLYDIEYQKYIQYRDFFQNEFTSRLKSSLTKKYAGFNDEDEFSPIKEVIQRVCGTLNADGGCYIKYNLANQTFRLAAPYGDQEYLKGINQYISKINKKDKTTLKKSRVWRIVQNYYNASSYESIWDLISFNKKECELLQPIPNKVINSNIAIPVTFKHKLLGILLIDSFRKNIFTKNDIQLILSISNALSIQIYDNIVEKKLFSIIENIPNQTELEDEKAMESKLTNLTRYINSIFFSIAVDIWIYKDRHFKRVSSTLPQDSKFFIHENEPELICSLIDDNILEVYDDDIRNSGKFTHSKPYKTDTRINTAKIYAIRQDDVLIGALSVYNKKSDDYLSIDNLSLRSVKNHLKIFFSTIHTFKKQRELIHSNALHDISQNLMMIDGKCQQLTELLHENFRDIDHYTRYRFGVKIKDIDRFTENTKLSFNFITGKGKEFIKKNPIDKQIQEQYGPLQDNCNVEVKLSDIIYRIINSVKYEHKNLKIIPTIEDMKVKIPEVILEDIFSNLIQNAVKYSLQDSVIKIRTVMLKYVVQLRIENIGLEIKSDEIYDIFEYGYRGFEALEFEEDIGDERVSYPRGESENSGFGLYKCKNLTKLFGGNIKLEKSIKIDRGYSNTFLFTIPTTMINQKEVMKKMESELMKKFEGKGKA